MNDEDTLEFHKLIVGRDEAEHEAVGTISEYLIERAAKFGNKLGLNKKQIKELDIVKDPISDGWILICGCERKW